MVIVIVTPTSLTWINGTRTLSWSGDGTNDVFDLQVSTVSNFSSTEVDETEWVKLHMYMIQVNI